MITTIQIRNNIKKQLQLLKEENQSFEDVIVSLLEEREKHKEKNIDLIQTEAKELNSINTEISKNLEDVEDIGGEVVKW